MIYELKHIKPFLHFAGRKVEITASIGDEIEILNNTPILPAAKVDLLTNFSTFSGDVRNKVVVLCEDVGVYFTCLRIELPDKKADSVFFSTYVKVTVLE